MISENHVTTATDKPETARVWRRRPVVQPQLASQYAALLRHVQTRRSAGSEGCYILGITSCEPGEGVATVAANLAVVAAHKGHRRVLLVDADPHGSGAARLLGVPTQPGLRDVLTERAMLGDCLQASSVPGLTVLPAGRSDAQWGPDFDGREVQNLLDELKSEYEFVIFDLAPADDLSESFAVAELLDGILLVVEAGSTDARGARRVRQRLEEGRSEILGVVCTRQQ